MAAQEYDAAERNGLEAASLRPKSGLVSHEVLRLNSCVGSSLCAARFMFTSLGYHWGPWA